MWRSTTIGREGVRCPSCSAVDHLALIEIFPEPPESSAHYGGSGRWRCRGCGVAVLDLEGELRVEGADDE